MLILQVYIETTSAILHYWGEEMKETGEEEKKSRGR